MAKDMNYFERGDKYKHEVSGNKRMPRPFYSYEPNGLSNWKRQTLCCWFACEPILHYREMALCFYLVGCLLSKGAHYVESLFYCVQQINKWEAQWEK